MAANWRCSICGTTDPRVVACCCRPNCRARAEPQKSPLTATDHHAGRVLYLCIMFIIVSMVYACTANLVLTPAHATWKPDYAKNPAAVKLWFHEAAIPGWKEREKCKNAINKDTPWAEQSKLIDKCTEAFAPAYARLHIASCCEKAERLLTKFVPTKDGDWMYYTDPACTVGGCPLAPIKSDVVHKKPIQAVDPKDDDLAEFSQMRQEGVLFIYHGEPSCFWPPQSGI